LHWLQNMNGVINMARKLVERKARKFLQENGRSLISRIFDYINESTRDGTTMSELSNTLRSAHDIEKCGTERVPGRALGSGTYILTVWQMKGLEQ